MSKLEIEVVDAQELPDEMKSAFDVEAHDCSTFMIVTHNEENIIVINDYMEPEDSTFRRDLSWIPELLNAVYLLGKGDRDV